MTEQISTDDKSQCGRPCHPDSNCPECAPYWERMAREGYWDKERHAWTEKGWYELTKSF